MIATNLADEDGWLPSALKRAFAYLRETDFSRLKSGTYPIEGRDMFAKVFSVDTQDIALCKAEFHNTFIDVQYWADGAELLACSQRQGDEQIIESHPDDDLYFCPVPDEESLLHAKKGDIVVFFPSDIHRPGGAWRGRSVTCRKVVVKVNARLIGRGRRGSR